MAVKKFTDEELFNLYKRGFSDRVIANVLGASGSVVFRRRCKLGLIANYYPKLNRDGLKRSYKNQNKNSCEHFRTNHPDRVKDYKNKYSKTEKAITYRKKYSKTYRLREDVLKKEKIYLFQPEIRKKRKENNKKWREQNPEKCLQYAKKRSERKWANNEEREIMKCNQILSGLLYAKEKKT